MGERALVLNCVWMCCASPGIVQEGSEVGDARVAQLQAPEAARAARDVEEHLAARAQLSAATRQVVDAEAAAHGTVEAVERTAGE